MSSRLARYAAKRRQYKAAVAKMGQALVDISLQLEADAHNEVFQHAWDSKFRSAAEIRTLGNLLLRCSANERISFTTDGDGREQLKILNDAQCRRHVCPPCSARKADKDSGVLRLSMDHIWELHSTAEALALTLTAKNYSLKDLKRMLDDMRAGFNRFRRLEEVKAACLGMYCGTEIAIRGTAPNWEAGVHYHIICMRGEGQPYLSHARYRELWKNSLRVDYLPQIRIHKVAPGVPSHRPKVISKLVAEAAKYVTKPQSICKFKYCNDARDFKVEVDPHVILTVARALFNRRDLRVYDRAFFHAKRQALATIKARKEQRKNSGGFDL